MKTTPCDNCKNANLCELLELAKTCPELMGYNGRLANEKAD